LQGIILQDVELEDTHLEILMKALRQIPMLISLNLSSNRISDKGIEIIGNELKDFKSLEYIFLKNNANTFSPVSVL